jgi:hypothetical protein
VQGAHETRGPESCEKKNGKVRFATKKTVSGGFLMEKEVEHSRGLARAAGSG